MVDAVTVLLVDEEVEEGRDRFVGVALRVCSLKEDLKGSPRKGVEECGPASGIGRRQVGRGLNHLRVVLRVNPNDFLIREPLNDSPDRLRDPHKLTWLQV